MLKKIVTCIALALFGVTVEAETSETSTNTNSKKQAQSISDHIKTRSFIEPSMKDKTKSKLKSSKVQPVGQNKLKHEKAKKAKSADSKGEWDHLTAAEKRADQDLPTVQSYEIPEAYRKYKHYNPKLFAGVHGDPTFALGLMVPLWQRDNQLILTQIGQDYNSGLRNTSADFAYRRINGNQTQLWGVYGGLDFQRSKKDNHFKSLTLGAELRTERWHTYANVYVPLSDPIIETDYQQWQLQPTNDGTGFSNVVQKRGEEVATLGVDGAIGYTFLESYNARFYLGGYHYQAVDVRSLSGPKATLEFDIYNAVQRGSKQSILERITFQGVAKYDEVNYGDVYAGVTFVFNIGHKKNLTGMQRFMMYQMPRQYGTVLRPNDNVPLSLFRNADGTPFTVAQVSNNTQFENAVTNSANVIAVQGDLTNLDTQILKDGQDITGGDYTLNNGVVLNIGSGGSLTAAAGQDLIQVTNNNTIENISLNADSDKSVIVNDLTSSFGNVTVNKVTANTGINVLVNDGGTSSNLTVTDSTFTMGDVSNKNLLNAQLDSGTARFTFNNNTITMGDGSSNNAIRVLLTPSNGATSTATVSSINQNNITLGVGGSNKGISLTTTPGNTANTTANLTIGSINSNTVTLGGGAGNLNNNGIHINTADTPNGKATVLLSNLQNNTISIGGGEDSAGIYLNLFSFSGNSHLTVKNITNNTVNFTAAGTTLSGIEIDAGNLPAKGTLIIDTFYGNSLAVPEGTGNFAINMDANTQGKIIITVNNNGLSLAAANNLSAADVTSNGDVEINPSEDTTTPE